MNELWNSIYVHGNRIFLKAKKKSEATEKRRFWYVLVFERDTGRLLKTHTDSTLAMVFDDRYLLLEKRGTTHFTANMYDFSGEKLYAVDFTTKNDDSVKEDRVIKIFWKPGDTEFIFASYDQQGWLKFRLVKLSDGSLIPKENTNERVARDSVQGSRIYVTENDILLLDHEGHSDIYSTNKIKEGLESKIESLNHGYSSDWGIGATIAPDRKRDFSQLFINQYTILKKPTWKKLLHYDGLKQIANGDAPEFGEAMMTSDATSNLLGLDGIFYNGFASRHNLTEKRFLAREDSLFSENVFVEAPSLIKGNRIVSVMYRTYNSGKTPPIYQIGPAIHVMNDEGLITTSMCLYRHWRFFVKSSKKARWAEKAAQNPKSENLHGVTSSEFTNHCHHYDEKHLVVCDSTLGKIFVFENPLG